MAKGLNRLPEEAAEKVCAAYGIECPPSVIAAGKEECISAAEKMGFPVVLKIYSPDISHKSDAGGVAVNLQTREETGKAFDAIMKSVSEKYPDAAIAGMEVQKMMPPGVEVIIGGLRNDQFGPVVMFGLGGIYIEVFRDIEFRLAPLTMAEARRQIEQTRVYRLLQGVRGNKPCDLDALCRMLVNTGDLLLENEEIREVDFNPVLCYEDRCVAVDARIVIGK
nr:acetate--CoA ligase family protein [Lachnospiraceae bacterium]